MRKLLWSTSQDVLLPKQRIEHEWSCGVFSASNDFVCTCNLVLHGSTSQDVLRRNMLKVLTLGCCGCCALVIRTPCCWCIIQPHNTCNLVFRECTSQDVLKQKLLHQAKRRFLLYMLHLPQECQRVHLLLFCNEQFILQFSLHLRSLTPRSFALLDFLHFLQTPEISCEVLLHTP